MPHASLHNHREHHPHCSLHPKSKTPLSWMGAEETRQGMVWTVLFSDSCCHSIESASSPVDLQESWACRPHSFLSELVSRVCTPTAFNDKNISTYTEREASTSDGVPATQASPLSRDPGLSAPSRSSWPVTEEATQRPQCQPWAHLVAAGDSEKDPLHIAAK